MSRFYLGDGLYAEMNSLGDVRLSTPRINGEHFVVLDTEVMQWFFDWYESVACVDITITEKEGS